MPVESLAIDKWLFGVLSAGTVASLIGGTAAPRLYADQIPQGTVWPGDCVVFQMLAGEDNNAIGGNRTCSRNQWMVKAVTQADTYASAGTIMARVDALLQDVSGSAVLHGGTTLILHCFRLGEIKYPETDEGRRFNHLGGRYRIWAGPSA